MVRDPELGISQGLGLGTTDLVGPSRQVGDRGVQLLGGERGLCRLKIQNEIGGRDSGRECRSV